VWALHDFVTSRRASRRGRTFETGMLRMVGSRAELRVLLLMCELMVEGYRLLS